MIFPALLAKFLSAGAIAQAATGATVVVVAVTGAGAAGVLPDPVQDSVAAVVETVTPLDLPSTDDGVLPDDVPAVEPVTEEPVDPTVPADPAETEEGTEFDAVTWALEGPQAGESFGDWVSQGAGDAAFKAALKAEGLNFGTIVRTWAHNKGLAVEELASELEAEGVDPAELTEVASDGDAAVQAGTTRTERSDGKTNGNGNGKTNGKANGKSGSKGNGGNGKGNGKGNGRN